MTFNHIRGDVSSKKTDFNVDLIIIMVGFTKTHPNNNSYVIPLKPYYIHL